MRGDVGPHQSMASAAASGCVHLLSLLRYLLRLLRWDKDRDDKVGPTASACAAFGSGWRSVKRAQGEMVCTMVSAQWQ
jgi:hypothetical protein